MNNGASQGIKIYSPALSLKIDDYYNYAPSGRGTISNKYYHIVKNNDFEKLDSGAFIPVYVGNHKQEKFETEKQKLSFLLGAYLCYGKDENKTNSTIEFLKKEKFLDENKEYEIVPYGFSMSNAPRKAKICVEFLRDLGCKDVEYVLQSGYIPVGHHVIFIPSDKIQEVINEAERLKNHIHAINTNHVKFTPDGSKFIWKEPENP